MDIRLQSLSMVGLMGAILLVSACGTVTSKIDLVYRETGNKEADRSAFTVCYAHGCQKRATAGLDDTEWSAIAQYFEPAPKNPEQERAAIRLAIGQFERTVGEQTGTDKDVGGSFTGFAKKGQLDCVDEMMNTATYVQLMINEGLVTMHEPGTRLTNTFFSNGNVWPHTAMTIRDLQSGDEWAIDSWWLKNGVPPYIVTREAWSQSSWDQPRSGEDKKMEEASKEVGAL